MKSLLSLVAFLVLCPGLPSKQIDAAEKHNVLFIAIDDLNDWIGCLDGHPQAMTPNIDALAQRGILFTNAHCASPACNPSRAALLSGKLPDKTGVWSNDTPRLFQAKPKTKHLPGAFRDAGYETMGTGKINHGTSENKILFERFYNTEQRWSPLTRKAVRYTPSELPSKATSSPHHEVSLPGGQSIVLPLNQMPSDRRPDSPEGESFDWGPVNVPDGEMGDVKITDWAIEQLGRDRNQPFFLGVGYYRPHIPLWAPAQYFERFQDIDIELPPTRKDDLADLSDTGRRWALEAVTAGSHATVVQYDQWRDAVKGYLACTTFVDTHVGRLMESLRQSDDFETTWIVLWTDHGWHLGEKEHWGKWTPWERSTRVPLIIVPPPAVANQYAKAGSRCDQPVSLLDLFPTLTELCGVSAPKGLDGESLVPLLKNPSQETGRNVVTVIDQGNLSLRNRRWRYIRYREGDEELYDLQADPNEYNNLAKDPKHQADLERMRQALPKSLSLRGETASVTSPRVEPTWKTREMLGWQLHIDQRLTVGKESSNKLDRALQLLEKQLAEVVQKLPADAVVELRKVPLWFSPTYPDSRPRAEYHPSPQWLRDNDRDPSMARGVEFSNINIFEAESRRMPNFALHELAHAFHDRVLGFDRKDIREAYELAAAGGKYDSVLRQDSAGKRRLDRAYALSNHKEYFAELTEAYFSTNDFYPFDREQLLEVDPEGATTVRAAWGVDHPAAK